MLKHIALAALIDVAEEHFRIGKGTLRVGGGRYVPLCQFRQITQFVAYERGHNRHSIGMAFDYGHDASSTVGNNIRLARRHLQQEAQPWWLETKAILEAKWDEAIARG